MELRTNQDEAIRFATVSCLVREGAGLILAPGLGKTTITLHAIDAMSLVVPVPRVLVLCPPRVMSHWKEEQELWNTGKDVHLLQGSGSKRMTTLTNNHAGIFVLSDHLIPWLLTYKGPGFSLVVFDESSRYKSWSAERTKAARRIIADYRIILSGTPTPNNQAEIFPQQFLLDRGKVLGDSVTKFRRNYMYKGGFEGREWLIDDKQSERVRQLVAPYYLRQSAEDYLDIPDIMYNTVPIPMPKSVKDRYQQLKTDLHTELQSGESVIALRGSDKYRMLRQLASGGLYDEDGDNHDVHTAKLQALQDLHTELGEPTIVAYQYTREYDHMCKFFKRDLPVINGKTTPKQQDAIIEDWQDGIIPLLAVQSQAISHGVDGLQKGGRYLIWFTLTDSSEVYTQLIARLHRTGQTKKVSVFHLQTTGTIDASMLRLVQNKITQQDLFLDFLDARVDFATP